VATNQMQPLIIISTAKAAELTQLLQPCSQSQWLKP